MPSKTRILVVDDEPDICKLVARGLEELGYSIDTAMSPSDAAKLAREAHYSVVVSDYVMSDERYGNGIQLIDELSRVLPATRFVLLTGKGNDLVQEQAFLSGAVRYIRKGASIKAICARIDDVARREDGTLRLRLPTNITFAGLKDEAKKAYFAFLSGKYSGSAPAIGEAAETSPATIYSYLERYGIPFRKRASTGRCNCTRKQRFAVHHQVDG